MEGALLAMERKHIWDPHLFGLGLLRGDKLRSHLEATLASLGAATTFEECRCPLGMTAFHAGPWGAPAAGRTVVLSGSGPLAAAVSASVAVPGLFAPAAVHHAETSSGHRDAEETGDEASEARCEAEPGASGCAHLPRAIFL
jgi:predicted acylesterase/phospholipase RssA